MRHAVLQLPTLAYFFISSLVDFMYCNFCFQITLAVRTARSAWEHE